MKENCWKFKINVALENLRTGISWWNWNVQWGKFATIFNEIKWFLK